MKRSQNTDEANHPRSSQERWRDSAKKFIKRWWDSINKPIVLTFALFTVALATIGFSLQPAAAGPPALQAERGAEWLITINPTPVRAVITESIDSCTGQTCSQPNFTYLNLSITGSYSSQVKTAKVSGVLGGNYSSSCPRPTFEVTVGCAFNRTVHRLQKRKSFSFNVYTTWPTGVFFADTGSYAAGFLPGLGVAVDGRSFHLSQEFNLLSDISWWNLAMQYGPSPPSVSPGSTWQWNYNSSHVNEKVFTLTDPSGVQNDSRKIFLSGIVLGIAGAALIALAEELIRALGRRE